jgi:hypothetical protein
MRLPLISSISLIAIIVVVSGCSGAVPDASVSAATAAPVPVKVLPNGKHLFRRNFDAIQQAAPGQQTGIPTGPGAKAGGN